MTAETNNRMDELINKYLDEVLSVDELKELNEALIGDVEAAREFAKATRQDGYLCEHFSHAKAAAWQNIGQEHPRSVESGWRRWRTVSWRDRCYWSEDACPDIAAGQVNS